MDTKKIARRLRLVAAALLAAVLVVPATSSASPARVQELRAELNKINDEFKKAGKQYDDAYWKLDETEKRIETTRGEIAEREVELADSRELLGKRVAAWYRADEAGLLGFILGSEDFRDFVTRLDAMQRIGSADAAIIDRTETLLRELGERERELEKTQAEQAKRVREFEKRRDALQKRMTSKKSEYERVQRELAEAQRRAQQAAAARSAASVATAPSRGATTSVAGPNGMVFPVAGPNYYSDTWGASRAGGRRSHKGTDIMAATGTPVVATMSGTVSAGNGATSGLYLRLRADNGWTFYYMHLNSIIVSSGRVSAGQTIGTVGYTGNASASAPHLHYEIHLPGRGAVNPYPYLRQM